MKLTVQLELTPVPEHTTALVSTLETCNAAANEVSDVAYTKRTFRNFHLRRLTDGMVREHGLGAQAAQHIVKKVADAYTKSAKRVLKRQRRKEARRARDTNHCSSKRIVAEAERTGCGIVLEDLTGIRDRVRFRKPQRVTRSSWSFHQLGGFIVYKAQRAGVPVVYVDPAYTSRMCADCGHVDKKNRVSQAWFACRSCGVVAHADRNSSRNIAARAAGVWDAGRPSSAPATRSA